MQSFLASFLAPFLAPFLASFLASFLAGTLWMDVPKAVKQVSQGRQISLIGVEKRSDGDRVLEHSGQGERLMRLRNCALDLTVGPAGIDLDLAHAPEPDDPNRLRARSEELACLSLELRFVLTPIRILDGQGWRALGPAIPRRASHHSYIRCPKGPLAELEPHLDPRVFHKRVGPDHARSQGLGRTAAPERRQAEHSVTIVELVL